jgi:hypothetical protein
MRVLFVTYCFGDFTGQALIGVYKRSLRVAMEMWDRGHEVVFYCTGREQYEDDLTRLAETRFQFIDLGFEEAAFAAAEENRSRFFIGMQRLDLDLVVIGEAPLAGALLEATLCAVELSVPVVFLDNAYNPIAADEFCRKHGGMADGIVLTGPSCHHTSRDRSWLKQVPPFIESASLAASRFVGLTNRNVVTVLAYDNKVGQVALKVLKQLGDRDIEYVILTRRPEAFSGELDELGSDVAARVRVIGQPPDPIMFGLLELSRLAIVKYGYMQVTECLALHTPVIAVYHEGPTWVEYLPPMSRSFIHVAEEADESTVAAARSLMKRDPGDMDGIHRGGFAAAKQTAEFLEQLPRAPRLDTVDLSASLGFGEVAVQTALASAIGSQTFRTDTVRAMHLRSGADGDVYSLLCGCTIGGTTRYLRLWARRYKSRAAAETDWRDAAESSRRPLSFWPADHVLIEEDVGQQLLPTL